MRQSDQAPTGSSPVHGHDHHPHLIDADEDRWAWRAKIRRNPTQLFFYRIGVGAAGLVLMIAAVVTGPLPGPGGIPLFLLGLAVWASEFEWAQNVMLWFKAQFHRYAGWSRPRRLLFLLGVAVVGAACAYAVLLTFGVPPWAPGWLARWLTRLPGV